MGSIFPLLAYAPDSPEATRCRGQLRAVTGVPVAQEVRDIWIKRFGVEHINSFGYGLTEGSRLALHRYRGPEHLPPLNSCGELASDRYEVVVLDENDRPLTDGEVGEIAFRPRRPNVMFDGYWKRPEETVRAQRNLWMHSGDLGRIENGILFFVDRQKDYLRNRGENISSFEIERAFLAHPDLAEVAVHEVGTGIAEDRMKVTAIRVEGSTLTEEELLRWALDRVPYFAVPRYIEFRDDFSQNSDEQGAKSFSSERKAAPRRRGTARRPASRYAAHGPKPGHRARRGRVLSPVVPRTSASSISEVISDTYTAVSVK